MADPLLIVFAGLSGTGKTSLARAVARQVHAAYLHKNTIRDCALAVGSEMKVTGANEMAGPLSDLLLIDQARDNLTLGLPVVLDSPAAQESFRVRVRLLGRSLKADLRWIECICSDEELLRERVERREPSLPGQPSREWSAYQEGRGRFERMTDRRLVVDTAEPQALNVRKILVYLAGPAPREAPSGPADDRILN